MTAPESLSAGQLRQLARLAWPMNSARPFAVFADRCELEASRVEADAGEGSHEPACPVIVYGPTFKCTCKPIPAPVAGTRSARAEDGAGVIAGTSPQENGTGCPALASSTVPAGEGQPSSGAQAGETLLPPLEHLDGCAVNDTDIDVPGICSCGAYDRRRAALNAQGGAWQPAPSAVMRDGQLWATGISYVWLPDGHYIGGKRVEAPETQQGMREDDALILGLHPDSQMLVADFAHEMAIKLRHAERKYGYSNGWLTDDWEHKCRADLHEHLGKGDPRDVAIYAAFMWKRGWATSLTVGAAPQQGTDEIAKPLGTADRQITIQLDGLHKAASHDHEQRTGRPLVQTIYGLASQRIREQAAEIERLNSLATVKGALGFAKTEQDRASSAEAAIQRHQAEWEQATTRAETAEAESKAKDARIERLTGALHEIAAVSDPGWGGPAIDTEAARFYSDLADTQRDIAKNALDSLISTPADGSGKI